MPERFSTVPKLRRSTSAILGGERLKMACESADGFWCWGVKDVDVSEQP